MGWTGGAPRSTLVRLPGASPERQKYLREQTESLQRRERKMCAIDKPVACSAVVESNPRVTGFSRIGV
jgi:hypothetical protein